MSQVSNVGALDSGAILIDVTGRDWMIVSNRGPVSFGFDADRNVIPVKGGGGLAGSLKPLLTNTARWMAFAMSEADELAARNGLVGQHAPGAHLVTIDAETYDLAYNVVANQNLWFAHHGLPAGCHASDVDTSSDADDWAMAWDAFEAYNLVMADAVARVAAPDAAILIQDYHLCLVAPTLREARPDLRLVHFSHTPFVGPAEEFLPSPAAMRVVESMAAHHACGFHSRRWADAMIATSELRGVKPAHTFVSPLAPDLDTLRSVVTSDACQNARRELEAAVGDQLVIGRVDRIEPTKNIQLGFEAYAHLLAARPDLHGQVVFCAYVYPSRETLAGYRNLKSAIEHQVGEINARFGRPGWTPITLDVTDNLAGAVAVLSRYDVLLVNPLRDGLNLVAIEGPLVNERSGQLALSTEAGAHDVMGSAAFSLDPTSRTSTAEALSSAFRLNSSDREARALFLRKLAAARTPHDWLRDQLEQAG